VHLAFGGARADGAPGDQVADVLRADGVQELAGGRHAQAVDLQQQLAGDAQALVDAEALVQVGVVDQALPAHRGARLLEVHAHHDLQRVLVLLAQVLQAAGVVHRGGRVVDRAGPDDDQQAVVMPVMMSRTARRVCLTSFSTGVPAMGKKRIRCSGGGKGMTSWMRSSSASLVRLLGTRGRASMGWWLWRSSGLLAWAGPAKKPPGVPAVFWGFAWVQVRAFASPAARRGENQ
jgi:hypothetical protein